MYNAHIKERFLSERKLVDVTKTLYQYIFEKASITENDFDKDICQMTPYECDQLILSFPRRSEGVLQVLVSVLKKYVDFCINIKFTTDYNYFSNIIGANAVRKYLDMTCVLKKYLTIEELREMQRLCRNDQDVLTLELPFNALRGDAAEEILGLQVNQVFSNKIVLSDREIPISDKTYEIIENAKRQKIYYRGVEGITESKYKEIPINETNFVLRTAGSTKSGPMIYSSYSMRIERLKQYFGNPYINITNLYHAGMIHRLKELKKLRGRLEKEDYQEICRIFGIRVESWSLYKFKFDLYL